MAAVVAQVAEAWSSAENFGLYDDVLPCLRALRDGGVRMALASNAIGHTLEEMVAHFALDEFIEVSVSSAEVGVVKPACAVFGKVRRTGVPGAAAVMVGDSLRDDVEGALACGCSAILLDRAGGRPAQPCRASLRSWSFRPPSASPPPEDPARAGSPVGSAL